MNCCDDYGNCRQGRDCPVRKERQRGHDRVEMALTATLYAGAVTILIVGAVAASAVIGWWLR